MDERSLLRRLKEGDTEALGEIIGLYSPYLCAVASNILAPRLPREDIEEVVSDTFVALWTHRSELLPGKTKAWLAAVARNRAKDALRAAHLDEPLDDDLLTVAAPENVEKSVFLAELSNLAREAVASLGEPDCEIFRRRYFLYQKTEDIAAGLNMNAATVRTRLARGRERLRRYFTERGISCADPNL